MTRVLVIIVSYNGMPWLERCLGSVYPGAKTCHFAPDLYVWDNDSTDGSADYVAKHFPGAHLVRSAENVGFAKANNMGFQYALDHGYDYVYLLNQDAWLAPGALETLVAAAQAHPDYAVLSPLQYQDGYQAFDLQFAKLYHGSVEVKRIMAAHWLVPVGALKIVGPFEEELFPLYGQDDDWCNRARYHKLKVGIVPDAKAVHDRALRQEPKEKVIRRNYYTGSLIRLCDPNRPLWERFLFVCLFTLVKSVKYGSLLPFKYFRQICGQLPAVRRHRDFSIRC
jgi:GT2 family glycosyltransferase